MIKSIKKLFESNNEIKVDNKIIEIEDLICEEKFEKAKVKFNKLMDFLDDKFNKSRTHKVLLLDLYLHFIFNYHMDILKKTNEFVLYIEETESLLEEIKQYYKAFIYNIEMVSSLACGEVNRANIAREHLIKYDYSIYDSGNLDLDEIQELEDKYPIAYTTGRNMALDIISNEYSKELTVDKIKIIKKYLFELQEVLYKNKKPKYR